MRGFGDLTGKVAIVTGIGSGIGKGCAEVFAAQGARVVGCDISAEAADATTTELQHRGLEIACCAPCDLTVQADVDALIAKTLELHGGFDILINAAATARFMFIEEMNFEDWRWTIAGELDLVFLACKAAWPHLVKRGGGSIINLASANSFVALEGSGALAHCAGKGGVLAMTRQLAMEGGPHNIRANCIAPGMIVTGATAPVLEDEAFKQRVLSKAMIKRLGRPEDVAWCAVYLASDQANWVTGADFSIDAGATAW